MATDIRKINEKSGWQELTEGMCIIGRGTSKDFNTGEWRTDTPIYIEDECRQCLICTPVCPDSCIPVTNGKRAAFDLEHCKGCGICVKACPFGAIVMEGGK